ncbi:MAG: hypothetical protein IJX72_07740 [Clostridia bacterium]|nr:hypothetical protein [Clostridia bacterium]
MSNQSKRLVVLSAACGVGKSTVKNALNELNLLPGFACIDSDEVQLNWWNYKGTPREKDYTADCLARALELADERHLLFATCNAPTDFFARIPLPESITVTYIGMVCSDAEVRRRLLARPPERMCSDEAFIASQIDYNGWIRDHAERYDLHLDNTDMTVTETAEAVAAFVRGN